jgi:hemerythrin-like domain-containing protein
MSRSNITQALVAEHTLILRMLALLERNAPRTAAGEYTNWQFYLDGVDFIRSYADRFHHAKEEDVLFAALVTNGMPREHSPVAAMLLEHDQGRAYVRAMEEATLQAKAGNTEARQAIADNALAYVALLWEHITKEDTILYPLAERLLPEEMRAGIISDYATAEAKVPVDFTEHYQRLVAQYEAEPVGAAA